MGNKLLNLKLLYKGKQVNFAYQRTEGSPKVWEFKNSFILGSDPHLFWQILDDRFPKKFSLISKKGDNFILHLTKGMNLSVMRGDDNLTMDDLKQQRLLNGNSVTLDERTSGTIGLNPDYQIQYSFQTPRPQVLSQAEIAMIREFNRKPAATAEATFTKWFLIISLLVTLIGLTTFNLTYEPKKVEHSIVDLYQQRDLATQVSFDVQQPEDEGAVTDYGMGDKVDKDAGVTEEQAQEIVQEAQAKTVSDIAATLGEFNVSGGGTGSLDETGIGQDAIFEVNQAADIVAAGPAKGASRTTSSAAIAQFDTKGAKASEIMSGEGGLDAILADGNLNVGAAGGKFEAVDLDAVGASGGQITRVTITGSAQFESIKAARYSGLRTVRAQDIETSDMSASDKNVYVNIRNYVRAFEPQITQAFRRESAIVEMYGSLEIILYINEQGMVEGADLAKVGDSFFTDDFLQKAHTIITKWKFPVKSRLKYQWRMNFMK